MRGRRCITLTALRKPTGFLMSCMPNEKQSVALNLIELPPSHADATGIRAAIHD